MTNKRQLIIQLNEIKETGFYCAIDDKKRETIFEVVNETYKDCLKNESKCALFIYEWIYEYTDQDKRKIYFCNGTRELVNCSSSLVKVIKIKDTKYQKTNAFNLIAYKSTYKKIIRDQFEENQRLKHECEELKKKIEPYNCSTNCHKYIEADHYCKTLEEIEKIVEVASEDYRMPEDVWNKIVEIINNAKRKRYV